MNFRIFFYLGILLETLNANCHKSIIGTLEKIFDNKYECVKRIAKGTSGTIFKIKTKTPDSQDFVLKVIPRTIKNYKNELNVLKEVNELPCKYIGKLINNSYDDYNIYLLLPFGDGGDMFDFVVNSEEEISFEFVYEIAEKLATGLQCLHKAGFIHKDIKLENVIIKDKEPLIIDFDSAGHKNINSEVAGTPCYYSPLSIGKEELEYNESFDLFSLGVLLYSLKYGEQPFSCQDEKEYVDSLLKGEYTYPKETPKVFTDLIDFALSSYDTTDVNAATLFDTFIEKVRTAREDLAGKKELHLEETKRNLKQKDVEEQADQEEILKNKI